MKLRSLKDDERGMVEYIIIAVVAAVLFAVSIAVVYSVLGGIDYTTIDAGLTGTPAANASGNVLSNLDTFYSVGPIYIVVIAAVAIIGAIMYLRKGK